jgi:pyruvate dehydrogenase E1 component beta subunit
VDGSSEIPEEDFTVPFGQAVIRRPGKDVTLIGHLLMMHRCLQAAALLEREGLSAEVIDPRSLVPFDWETVKASVARTGRVVIVEESPKRSGVGAEIAATLAEEALGSLRAPVKRVAAPNTPAPFAPPMEQFYVPSVERIAAAVREVCGTASPVSAPRPPGR